MPNSNYRAGRDLEYAAAKDLEANGYFVIRAAGSHGLADLIGFKPGEVLIVQCKTDGKMTPAQRGSLTELADMIPLHCGTPLIARWQATGPRGGRTVTYTRTFYMLPTEPWTPDHALEATP
jgi:Holliday junction resolvase